MTELKEIARKIRPRLERYCLAYERQYMRRWWWSGTKRCWTTWWSLTRPANAGQCRDLPHYLIAALDVAISLDLRLILPWPLALDPPVPACSCLFASTGGPKWSVSHALLKVLSCTGRDDMVSCHSLGWRRDTSSRYIGRVVWKKTRLSSLLQVSESHSYAIASEELDLVGPLGPGP